MAKYDFTHIKNIAIAGAAGSGKTSLDEALLYTAGATDRHGKIADGTTVSDYTSEEIKRKSSVFTALTTCEYNGFRFNFLDTPGLDDFAAEMIEGITAADSVMITVSAKSGVKTGTHKAFDECEKKKKPRMFVVTKIDDENANFGNVLTQLKTEFGPEVCPVLVPVIADLKIVSYINLIEMKAYKYENGKAVETEMPDENVSEKLGYRIDGLREAMIEAVAESDEELFEKFLSEEPFTQKELVHGLHKGVNSGQISPVTCISSETLEGADMLLKETELLLPTPSDSDEIDVETTDGDIKTIKCGDNSELCAYVFKTAADPFLGSLSFVKVISGTLKTGDTVTSDGGKAVKVGKIVRINGKKQTDLDAITCGDIAAVQKLDVTTDSTLSKDGSLVLEKTEYPIPCYSMAIHTTKQGDEGKINGALGKLCLEDMSLKAETDPETKELILSGIGEQHLLSKLSLLEQNYGITATLSTPKIAYRETIRKKVKVQGKYKKQSGGHGQYGDVWIEFEPDFSEGMTFEEKIVGGAVPKNFFPAVEKGVADAMQKGILGGFPVVGVKAVLVDGSYHPVDSSEMAFRTAASMATKEGLKEADPVILEPVGKLVCTVPEENTGDIIGELNKRRGRITGMNPAEKKGMTVIEADVPMREMNDFVTTVRSITQGAGYFTFTKERYEQLPAQLLTAVLTE